MDYLEIANKPILWVSCAPVVILVLTTVLSFTRKTLRIAVYSGIPRKDCFQAFRAGIITAIGPSLAIFVVMVGLMSSVGGPMSWMRLSVIGSADAELLHAGLGASVVGQTLGGEDYNIIGYIASVWGMSIFSISWLLFMLIFPRINQLQNKLAEVDSNLITIISMACMSGIMSFMSIENMLLGWDMIAAAFVAASCGMLLSKTTQKLHWLKEYHLGISMILGVIFGVIVASL